MFSPNLVLVVYAVVVLWLFKSASCFWVSKAYKRVIDRRLKIHVSGFQKLSDGHKSKVQHLFTSSKMETL